MMFAPAGRGRGGMTDVEILQSESLTGETVTHKKSHIFRKNGHHEIAARQTAGKKFYHLRG